MTLDELILSIEVEKEQALKARDRSIAEVKTILAKARNEGRANLTEDEERDTEAAFARRDKAKAELAGIAQKLANANKAKAAEDEIAEAEQHRVVDVAVVKASRPAYDQVARVGREERTYHQGNCRKGKEFLQDVVAQHLFRNLEAEMRLQRHMAEERVERGQYLERAAAGTGAFTGLVVPQYLTTMYAPNIKARRPFADAMTPIPLPPQGMTVNISKITTGTSTGLQATENTAVTDGSIDDTLLTENVQTAAGKQDLSRQAIERGAGVEDITMLDLQRQLATDLDKTIITQATTGLSAIATAVTYDDTTPTVAELYPKFAAASSGSETALLGQATPDLAVMSPRRWYWLQNALVSTWPLIGQPNIDPQNGGVNFAERYGSGFRGRLPNGLAVVVDANVPINLGAGTNQDEIYVAPSEESYLWEDPDAPQFIRAEQAAAANLTVQLILYSYFAYTMRRYANSHQKISGTGLVTPTFTGV